MAKTNTPAFEPSQVRGVGLQIGTGSRPDGGTFGAPVSVTLHLDSIASQ